MVVELPSMASVVFPLSLYQGPYRTLAFTIEVRMNHSYLNNPVDFDVQGDFISSPCMSICRELIY